MNTNFEENGTSKCKLAQNPAVEKIPKLKKNICFHLIMLGDSKDNKSLWTKKIMVASKIQNIFLKRSCF